MAKPSYDEITRKTIPDPDGSIRPSKEQVEAAYDGSRTRGQDEARLLSSVQSAVSSHDEGASVTIDVRNEDIELRGSVKNVASIEEIGDLVQTVPGVGSVVNKLVVAH